MQRRRRKRKDGTGHRLTGKKEQQEDNRRRCNNNHERERDMSHTFQNDSPFVESLYVMQCAVMKKERICQM